jgi:hypothetical protein
MQRITEVGEEWGELIREEEGIPFPVPFLSVEGGEEDPIELPSAKSIRRTTNLFCKQYWRCPSQHKKKGEYRPLQNLAQQNF